jgi:hypothetical protein
LRYPESGIPLAPSSWQSARGRRPGPWQGRLDDGILSAIDCKVTLEKKGERGVITIDAKFLHHKEY